VAVGDEPLADRGHGPVIRLHAGMGNFAVACSPLADRVVDLGSGTRTVVHCLDGPDHIPHPGGERHTIVVEPDLGLGSAMLGCDDGYNFRRDWVGYTWDGVVLYNGHHHRTPDVHCQVDCPTHLQSPSYFADACELCPHPPPLSALGQPAF